MTDYLNHFTIYIALVLTHHWTCPCCGRFWWKSWSCLLGNPSFPDIQRSKARYELCFWQALWSTLSAENQSPSPMTSSSLARSLKWIQQESSSHYLCKYHEKEVDFIGCLETPALAFHKLFVLLLLFFFCEYSGCGGLFWQFLFR